MNYAKFCLQETTTILDNVVKNGAKNMPMKSKLNNIIVHIFIFTFIFSSCQTNLNNQKEIQFNTSKGISFPNPIGYVNDFASILDSFEIINLETKIDSFEKNTSNQISIVIINMQELTEANFEQYALDLSNYWGVGTKEKNNGLTIVFSPHLRKIRICTGIGIENIITDDICKNIMDNIMIPEFKNGNYYNGLNMSLDELIRHWK